MPKVASIVSHNNAFAPSVDSNTIRGGIRSKIDTAANLAALFDPSAALQSNNNSQDLVKEKGTIVYVEDQSDYFILNDATASNVAPGSAGSGWITLLSAIGGTSAAAPAIVDNSGTPALASGITAAEIQSEIGLVPGISGDNILQATDTGNTLADNDFLRVDGTKIEGLPAADVVTALGLGAVENEAASGLYVKLDGTSTLTGGTLFKVEGSTDNSFETQIQVTDPTADRTVTFQDSTGTIALSANKLSFFASTSSAELAGVLSDETGTGNVVFSDSPTLTGTIAAASANFSSNVAISGNLSVAGTVTQSNSTEVNFNDTRLRLNVPTSLLDGSIENTAAPSANTHVGLEIFNGAAGNAFSNGPLWVYNYSTDHWGASVQGSVGTLDNVKAFKFNVTTSSLGAEANATNDIADLYGQSSSARSNDTNVRSIGAVSKCTIDITTDASDSPNNFAPVAAAANGYPIQHDLDTSSVFVFALKTHQAGAAGTGGAATAIGEPQPIFCKFKVLTSNIVEVSVGITIENEKYDIIVIG